MATLEQPSPQQPHEAPEQDFQVTEDLRLHYRSQEDAIVDNLQAAFPNVKVKPATTDEQASGPEVLEEDFQAQHDAIINRFSAAFPVHGVSDQEMTLLSDNVNSILKTSPEKRQKINPDDYPPRLKMAYEIASAYEDLANLKYRYSNEVVADDFEKATEWLNIDPAVLNRDDKKDAAGPAAEEAWFTDKPDLDSIDYDDKTNSLEAITNKVPVKTAESQATKNSNHAIVRDDRLRVYAITETEGDDPKEHSEATANAILDYYTQNTGEFKTPEEAINSMKQAFEAVMPAISKLEGDAESAATAVVIRKINGQPHAIVGSTEGVRFYRDTDEEGELTQLLRHPEGDEDAFIFAAIPLDADDRLVICSENVTTDPSIMRAALDNQDPKKAANYLIDNSDESADTSALIIDIDPTPEDEYELTEEEEARLQEIEAQEAAAASEAPTLVHDVVTPAKTEIRGPQKKLPLLTRAKILANRAMTGDLFRAKDNDGRFNKASKAVAAMAVGITAVSLAYRFGLLKEMKEGYDNLNSLGNGDGTGKQMQLLAADFDTALGSTVESVKDIASDALDAPVVEQAREAAESWTDKINPGDGITHTFLDYAHSAGKDISPERAYEIFKDAKEAGLMTPEHISNTSHQEVAGGIGFNRAGSTTLSPDVLEFLNKELDR